MTQACTGIGVPGINSCARDWRGETQQTWLHLGSTGCAGTVRKIDVCNAPNRVTVVLPEFDAANDTVVVDMGALFASDWHATDGDPERCLSEPGNDACVIPFKALGLPWEAVEVGAQRVFRVSR